MDARQELIESASRVDKIHQAWSGANTRELRMWAKLQFAINDLERAIQADGRRRRATFKTAWKLGQVNGLVRSYISQFGQ